MVLCKLWKILATTSNNSFWTKMKKELQLFRVVVCSFCVDALCKKLGVDSTYNYGPYLVESGEGLRNTINHINAIMCETSTNCLHPKIPYPREVVKNIWLVWLIYIIFLSACCCNFKVSLFTYLSGMKLYMLSIAIVKSVSVGRVYVRVTVWASKIYVAKRWHHPTCISLTIAM